MEAESLNQTQSSLIYLISLASLLCASPVFTFWGWNYKRAPRLWILGTGLRPFGLCSKLFPPTGPSCRPPVKNFYKDLPSSFPRWLPHFRLLSATSENPSVSTSLSLLFPHPLFLSHCHWDYLHFPRDWWCQTFSCAHWLLACYLCKYICSSF